MKNCKAIIFYQMISDRRQTKLKSTDQSFLNKVEPLMLCASRSVQALFLCLLYKTVLKSKSREKDTINLHTVKYFTILFPKYTLNYFSTQEFLLFIPPIWINSFNFYSTPGHFLTVFRKLMPCPPVWKKNFCLDKKFFSYAKKLHICLWNGWIMTF